MVVRRGQIWWAKLPEPRGAEPAFTRPVLIVQSNRLNETNLETVAVVTITSNLRLAALSGNVLLRRGHSGLARDSVVNVTQLIALDRQFLLERVGQVDAPVMLSVEKGLRMVLAL